MYSLLGKVLEAKKSCIQEGNHNPNKEELARRVGITVEKLEKLLYATRMPLSMQQPVWADQDTTFQVKILLVSIFLYTSLSLSHTFLVYDLAVYNFNFERDVICWTILSMVSPMV